LSNPFTNFFHAAMGQRIDPYPYQIRLASEPWPGIINIQTGMGKTAAIILSWLFKKINNDPVTPRRLVYCLPMRVLVEQTSQNAQKWINNLVESNILPIERKPSVHILMGGEIDREWDYYPEREAVIIGTQDQLLSRALNRGYGTSRFRWPVQFGLLNNDCIWVMDEIQLMGTGLATTTQLYAFQKSLGTALPVHSIWTSATLQREWLNTIDFSEIGTNLKEINLSHEDKESEAVKVRYAAKKLIQKAGCNAQKPNEIARFILDAHQKKTRTLVVVNTVKRALEIYNAIKMKRPDALLTLLHSRFRPGDRQRAFEKILANPGGAGSICISTQVVEAGVDVSAQTLITDLAPWASLVQRFGRCNRYGFDKKATVFWLELDFNKKGASLPYTENELAFSASILGGLNDVGPKNLPPVQSEGNFDHVLRRKDLIDLFDTSPDLAGMDIDISRFIRESEQHDCFVFWRSIPDQGPEPNERAPSRNELCPVSVGGLKGVIDLNGWSWDHLEKRWQRVFNIHPGMTVMLPASQGCYHRELGWTGKKNDIPELIDSGTQNEEANDDDFSAFLTWQSLSDHTDLVVNTLRAILSECNLPENGWEDILLAAAHWHDVGKVHEIFQEAMLGDPPEADTNVIWAKTGRKSAAYARKGFRHELASALAMLEHKLPDLAVYLAAAHHGKVRLSIRSLPHEKSPDDPRLRFARGIWDGDTLRTIDPGDGKLIPETVLDLSYMEFGLGPKGESWLKRMLKLRDDPQLGPFRLAYFEALLRSSDWRASQQIGETDA